MTKAEIIHEILGMDFDTTVKALNELVNQDRITTGAAYWVYSPYDAYGYKMVSDLISKAGKSKDYCRYIRRIPINRFNYWLRDVREALDKAAKFIQEQQSLPFDQTQKQILIQKGELKEC